MNNLASMKLKQWVFWLIMTLALFKGTGALCAKYDDHTIDSLEAVMKNAYYNGAKDQATLICQNLILHFQESNNELRALEETVFLSEILRSDGRLDQSLKSLEGVEKHQKLKSHKKLMARVLNRRSAILYELKRFDEALKAAQESINICERIGYDGLITSNLTILGAIHREFEEYDKAFDVLHRALRLAKRQDNPDEVITASYNLGSLYEKYGDADSLRYYAQLGLGQCKEHGIGGRMSFAHYLTAQACLVDDDYLGAFNAHRREVDLQDSLNEQKALRQIAFFNNQFEIEKREFDNQMLLERNMGKNRMIFILIALIIVGAVISAIVYWKNRKLSVLYGQMQEKEEVIKSQVEELESFHEAVQKRNEELNKANLVKDKFFSIVAHDLKSPINSLVGLFDLIRHDAIPEEDKERIYDKMGAQLTETQELMNNLLSWSRTQLGGVVVKKVDVRVGDLISRQLNLIEPTAKAKNITIARDIEDCVIPSDADMMAFITRNLLTNAVKFTQTGGEIALLCTKDDQRFTFEIGDNGVGMSEKQLEQIFTLTAPSTQGTAKEAGHGLGLVLSEEFARKLGGTLSVKSEEGKGSIFSLSLPI